MWLVEWINQNSQKIITVLTSANFIALVTMIIKVIFGAKQTTLLKNNVENLTSDLLLIANTKDEIAHNSKSNENLVERVSSLETALLLNNKALEAMLSIMGIVYMRSKDEDVRSSVASILSTFKNGKNKTYFLKCFSLFWQQRFNLLIKTLKCQFVYTRCYHRRNKHCFNRN